ncbi:hypothetical protein COV49_00520 [Candidatus Falkowbacteria bacterium CG11_big_fil_rev_8_21_14_0_20_39_10]|uniref:Uncharacterized protein n=1 Tax=Candidatus Falkowbacteria bacterium CG11_big_fil_rev_8_21_14_0_20_39_10 TaxID=1974570 RepID=A0A2M6KAA5_9BACT|nr:MAG: hypothetical protein COV49_00520 [Candidatus Falkowbacteria bacterium CG11_big_fil_rev_8_21_14_0_20_39_10]
MGKFNEQSLAQEMWKNVDRGENNKKEEEKTQKNAESIYDGDMINLDELKPDAVEKIKELPLADKNRIKSLELVINNKSNPKILNNPKIVEQAFATLGELEKNQDVSAEDINSFRKGLEDIKMAQEEEESYEKAA